jgi:hypothetical protein
MHVLNDLVTSLQFYQTGQFDGKLHVIADNISNTVNNAWWSVQGCWTCNMPIHTGQINQKAIRKSGLGLESILYILAMQEIDLLHL